ncbi:Ubiquitin-like protease family profile domain-containing protein [[Candida] zeylanoides]
MTFFDKDFGSLNRRRPRPAAGGDAARRAQSIRGELEALERTTREAPTPSIRLVSADCNGTKRGAAAADASAGATTLRLEVRADPPRLAVLDGDDTVCTLDRARIRRVTFSDLGRSLLVESRGYLYATYLDSDRELAAYLERHWGVEAARQPNVALLEKIDAYGVRRRTRSAGDVDGGIDGGVDDVADDGVEVSSDDAPAAAAPRESPPPFDPPLNYAFSDAKRFVVTKTDFKTLYNNDWINDSVVDFFIKYDIDRAVQRGSVERRQIYAFNSFFFGKLMGGEDHYANVRRWLSKVDLMAYDSVIIPINEHSHWYGCVIRGLPRVLAQARQGAAMAALDGLDDVEAVRSTRCEIFVIDSLSQKHANIHWPLKKLVIDYAAERHGVEVAKDHFRVVNARVPKQNNFNDCGIHLIYNVRRWLSDPTECERIWKGNSRHQARMFFRAAERNVMRQTLRQTLIELRAEMAEGGGSGDESEGEVIEIAPVPAAASAIQTEGTGSEKSTIETEGTGSERSAIETEGATGSEKSAIETEGATGSTATSSEQTEAVETASAAAADSGSEASIKTAAANSESSASTPADPNATAVEAIIEASAANVAAEVVADASSTASPSESDGPRSPAANSNAIGASEPGPGHVTRRTLDPRVASASDSAETRRDAISLGNKVVRQALAARTLPQIAVDVLNRLYRSGDRVDREELALIGAFVDKLSSFADDDAIATETERFIRRRPPPPRRPKDETLVIRHYSDDEMLHRVHGLSIKSPSRAPWASFPNKRRKRES